jgi:hypothetical protein
MANTASVLDSGSLLRCSLFQALVACLSPAKMGLLIRATAITTKNLSEIGDLQTSRLAHGLGTEWPREPA